MKTFRSLGVIGACLLVFNSFAQIAPKRLLIYYNYPSALGNSSTAANVFKDYDYVVLGAGIELSTHGAHNSTINILAEPVLSNTKFFGYIDLSITYGNYSIQEIKDRLLAWKQMGNNVKGVLLDAYGYDYGVTRERQNQAIAYAHSIGLSIIANAWNPDDAFSSAYHPTGNPTNLATLLDASDYYISESYLIKEGQFQDPTEWHEKAEKLDQFHNSIGFKTLSVTTPGAEVYSDSKFHYAWYGAALYNHEAVGWGEQDFGANQAFVPNRTPPAVNPGTSYSGTVQINGTEFYRNTNLGKLFIDTSTHAYGFIISSSNCISNVSLGVWNNPTSWTCNRIPTQSDDVTILSGHNISVNSPGNCRKLKVESGAVFSINAVFNSNPN